MPSLSPLSSRPLLPLLACLLVFFLFPLPAPCQVIPVSSLSQCPDPTGVATDSRGLVVAACNQIGAVRVIAINGTEVTTIGNFPNSSGQPASVSVDETSGDVFVAHGEGVSAISGGTQRLLTNGTRCSGVFASSSRATIYAACQRPGVLAITQSGERVIVRIIATPAQCPYASSVSTDPTSALVFASCLGGGGVISINGTTVSTIVDAAQCPSATSVTYDAASETHFVACSAGDVLSVRGGIVTTLATRIQCPSASDVMYDARSRMVIAACGGAGVIAISDAVVIPVATLTQCGSAISVAVDARTGIVLAACGESGIISIGGATITTLLSTAMALSLPCSYPVSVLKAVSRGDVFIACAEGGVVSVVGSAITMAATADQCPYTMALAQDEKRGIVYASCVEVGLIAINGTDVTVIAADSQCGNPSSVSVDENSGIVYASCFTGDIAIVAIDGSRIIPLVTRAQCAISMCVSVDSVRGVLYSACGGASGFFLSVSIVTHELTPLSLSSQAACVNPSSVFSDATSGLLCATCAKGTAGVVAINVTTGLTFTLASATQYPGAVNVFADSTSVYAACNDGGVIAIDSAVGAVTTIASASRCDTASNVFADSSGVTYAACLREGGPIAIGANFHCSDGSYWAASQCVPCPATTARLVTSDQTQRFYCPTCTPGSIAPSTGAVTCTACERGKYSTTADFCSPCLPGRYANVTGSSACHSCAAGSYGESVAESVGCKLCAAGTFSDATARISCSPCAVGRYSPSIGATSCVSSPPGSFVSYSGSDRSQACSAGSFSNSTAASTCLLCSAGRFSADNSTSCTDCETGTYTATEGKAACSVCLPGQYANSTTGCTPCPAGSASGGGGAGCKECEPGSYSLSPGSFTCLPCDRGTASSVVGSTTSCPPCPAGSYQSQSGQSFCPPCPADYYSGPSSSSCTFCSEQVNWNRTACVSSNCRANEQYEPANRTCVQCTLGWTSAAGYACVVCPLNSYTPKEGEDCISCQQEGMEGLSCAGGLATVKEDFFALVVVDESTGRERYQTYPCPLGFCHETPLQKSTINGGNEPPIQYCSSPRLNSPNNLLCGACEEGFIAWGEKCVRCEKTNGGLIFAALLISFFLVLFLLRSASSPSSSGSVVVLLYFIQTSALEVGAVSQWLRWIQVFNFGTESTTSCIAKWTPYEQMLFSLLMPIFLLAELFIIAAIHFALHRKYASRSEEELTSSAASASSFSLSRLQLILFRLTSRFSVDTYIGASFSILLFCYTQVTLSCVQYFYCVDVGESRLLFTSPTVDCRSAEYRSYLTVVILALITFVIGLPISILALLGYHRRNNNKFNFSKETKEEANLPSSSSSDSSPSPSLPADSPSLLFTRRFGPLYRMYSSHAWFYTPFVLLRRFSFVLTSVLLVQQPTLRFMSFALLNFFSLQLHSLIRPFTQEKTNSMETVSYGLLVAISVILTGFTPPYPISIQLLILFLILFPTLFFLFSVLREQWSVRLAQSTARHQSMEMIQIQREEELAVPVHSSVLSEGTTREPQLQQRETAQSTSAAGAESASAVNRAAEDAAEQVEQRPTLMPSGSLDSAEM